MFRTLVRSVVLTSRTPIILAASCVSLPIAALYLCGAVSPLTATARPKLSPDLARDQRIVTFVTAENYLALLKLCSEQNQSMSALCDQIICEYLSTRSASKTDITKAELIVTKNCVVT